MKAVVLAGGDSSRFFPFGENGHKTMVKLLGKPILQYTLEGLRDVGITDILIRVKDDGIVQRYFGDGSKFGLSIKYQPQKEALGMGEVLVRARNSLKEDFIFISAFHVNSKELVGRLLKDRKPNTVRVLVKKRPNPWDYGVVKLEGGRVVSVVEKPEQSEAKSDICIVGCYLLNREFLGVLAKEKYHHYNFETALDKYAKDNLVEAEIVEEVLTLKYPWDLLPMKDYLLKTLKPGKGEGAKIAKSSEIVGAVYIGEGAKILEGAKIMGPCYIGPRSMVGTNAILRGGVDVGEGCVVGANMEVKNSIIMDHATTHSGFIGDSIIGSKTKIAAQFTTGNVRLDRATIKTKVKDKETDTGLTSLGVIVGENVKFGINVSTMPGVIIGNNVVIGPSTTVQNNVSSNSKYYTKFAEVVEKKND